jgi:ribonucleotide reductase beta subunit family protein with ferritin-like domain
MTRATTGGLAPKASAPTGASLAARISYDDLYMRWEKGNWSATEIDLSIDREHWRERMNDEERRAAQWHYGLFLHGEHAVTATLSPFIDAAPKPEQKYFLATQQADEARHTVFFSRFLREVVGLGDDGTDGTNAVFADTSQDLTWGFQRLFERLDQHAEELRRDPSPQKLAAGILLYHLTIEAALGQPGQRFIEGYLERRGVLPGLLTGLRNVSRDEERHIAFGVRMLYDLVREYPDARDAIAEMLREVVPYSLSVFVPPHWDMRYIECFGYTMIDIYEEGTRSFEQKMRAAGLPPEDLYGALPMPFEKTTRERAERQVLLLRSGMIGAKNGGVSHEPEAVEALFDTVRLAVDTRHLPSKPTTIAWDFTDHAPWALRLADGTASTQQRPADGADLTFRCRLEDFVDVFAGREDPRMAMLKRKLRPRGDVRVLMRMQKLFGG